MAVTRTAATTTSTILLVLLLVFISLVSPKEEEDVCVFESSISRTGNDDDDCSTIACRHQQHHHLQQQQLHQHQATPIWKTGTLTPKDLPGPVLFSSFHSRNETIHLLNGKSILVSEGSVPQINKLQNVENDNNNSKNTVSFHSATNVSLLHQVVPVETVNAMLDLLRAYDDNDEYDRDPDTVDGMPTYEMFIDNPDLAAAAAADPNNSQKKSISTSSSSNSFKVLDSNPEVLQRRIPLRQKLHALTQPILDTVITPFVRQRYPEICNNNVNNASSSSTINSDSVDSRLCTPCYSLIRRYRYGERYSHAPHYDGHAIATVVVSLSDYNVDYRGGLYVGTGSLGAPREFMVLNKGDAVLHRSTLLHGVHVNDVEPANRTERWSWIIWYRDSIQCRDYSHDWFANCAQAGNALCQQLHSTKVSNIPGLTPDEIASQVLDFNMRAAHGGAGMAAVKVARAYLKQLPSSLPFDVKEARRYFVMAMESSHNPEGCYGLASLLLASAFLDEQQQAQQDRGGCDGDGSLERQQSSIQQKVHQAVRLLEEAAMAGHVFSMFNLGITHAFGYAVMYNNDKHTIDTYLAAEWFVESGLPEGYYVASLQAASVGNVTQQQLLEKRAKILGYGQVWRRAAREHTGSGGAGGVDLNLKWPTSPVLGTRPPEF